MEEAKIRRQPPKGAQPPHRHHRRRASGIGRETALKRGPRRARGHRRPRPAAAAASPPTSVVTSKEFVATAAVDIHSRESIARRSMPRRSLRRLDIVINTAALFPLPRRRHLRCQWAATLDINVTGNYLLADEAAKLFAEQGLDAPSFSPVRPTPPSPSAAPRLRRQQGSAFAPGPRTGVGLSPWFASMPSRRPPSSRAPRCSPATASAPRWPSTTSPSKNRSPTKSFAPCSPASTPSAPHPPAIDPADCAKPSSSSPAPLPLHLGPSHPVDGGLPRHSSAEPSSFLQSLEPIPGPQASIRKCLSATFVMACSNGGQPTGKTAPATDSA